MIAHILTERILDATIWDARTVECDSSGSSGSGARRELVPTDSALAAAPARDVWAVTADDRVVCWLWDGWCAFPGGERWDLTRQRSAGASLSDLSAMITRRLPKSSAANLIVTPPEGRPEDEPEAWLAWAGQYNGYERLAMSSEHLEALFEPPRAEYRRAGRVPDWCGTDLLRGWLFLLFREDHMGGSGLFCGDNPPSREWQAVFQAWSSRQ